MEIRNSARPRPSVAAVSRYENSNRARFFLDELAVNSGHNKEWQRRCAAFHATRGIVPGRRFFVPRGDQHIGQSSARSLIAARSTSVDGDDIRVPIGGELRRLESEAFRL